MWSVGSEGGCGSSDPSISSNIQYTSLENLKVVASLRTPSSAGAGALFGSYSCRPVFRFFRFPFFFGFFQRCSSSPVYPEFVGSTVAPTLLLDRLVILVSSFVARLSLSLSLVAPSAV